MVDTGSQVSLVSSSFVDRFRLTIEPLDRQDKTVFYSASGTKLNIIGKTGFRFQIDGLYLFHTFYVVSNLLDMCLVGVDFLTVNCCILHFGKSEISIMGDLVRAPLFKEDLKDCFVKTTKVLFIKPFSEAVIPVSCAKNYNNLDVKIEPVSHKQFKRYAVARSVSKVINNQTVCRILNCEPKMLILPRNTKIAAISTVDVKQDYVEIKNNNAESVERENGIQIDDKLTDEQLSNFHKEYGFKINENLTLDQKRELLKILFTFRSVFAQKLEDLKRYPNAEMKLQVKPGSQPWYRPVYKMTKDDARECHKQILEFEKANIIEPTRCSEINVPGFLVPKRETNDKRFVLDLRQANKNIVPFNIQLPNIEQLVHQLASEHAIYYSSMDLKSSFYQIKLHPESRHLTSFTDPLTMKKYQFTVAPMGLGNSVAYTCLALMEALGEMLGEGIVAVYVDDLAIFGKTWKSHTERLIRLLKTLKENNISINPKKTILAQPEISYLGFKISSDGCHLDESRVALMKALPVPTTKKELYRVLGCFSFCRRFIPNFVNKTYNMRQNLLKDKKFNFDEKCLEEFNYIKKQLTSETVLKPIDGNKTIYLFCDAAYTGLAFGLFMMYDGKLCPCAYGGRALDKTLKNSTPLQLELAAITLALQTYQHYIVNNTVRIFTDSLSAVYMSALSYGTPKERRMAAFLQRFNLEISHIKGSKNNLSDTLSRSFGDMPPATRVQFTADAQPDEDFILSVSAAAGESLVGDGNDAVRTDGQTDSLMSTGQITDRQLSYFTACFASSQEDTVSSGEIVSSVTPNRNPEAQGNVGQTRVDHTLTSTLNPRAPEYVSTAFFNQSNNQTQLHIINNPHTQSAEQVSSTQVQNDCSSERVDSAQPVSYCTSLASYNKNFQIQESTGDGWSEPTVTGNKNLVASAHKRRKKCQTEDRDMTDGNNLVPTDVVDVNSGQNDQPTDRPNDRTETDSIDNSRIYVPVLQKSDFTDEYGEFYDIYNYLSTQQLSGDDRRDRVTLLLAETFVIEDELLYRLTFPRNKRLVEAGFCDKRLCLPTKFREHCLKTFHEKLGHAGVNRCFAMIHGRYYWKSLYKDCTDYIRTCSQCLEMKRDYNKTTAPLHPILTPSCVGELYQMDHFVLSRPCGNFRCCLVITESYSGFVIITLTNSDSAEATSKIFIEKVLPLFGLTSKTTLLTDKGSGFLARVMRKIAEVLGIKMISSASGSARTNGKAERAIQEIKKALRMYAKNDLELQASIPIIELSLRNCPSETTRLSPAEIVFGRKIPIPLIGNANVELAPLKGDVKTYFKTVVERLAAIQEYTHENIEKSKQKAKENYDRINKVVEPSWQLGDRVLVKTKRLISNDRVITNPKFQGNYVIVDIVSSPERGTAYRVANVETGKVIRNLISHDRLKRDTSSGRADFYKRCPPLVTDSVNDRAEENRQTQTVTTADGADNTDTRDDDVDNEDDRPMVPALKVIRERRKGQKKEYFVLFEDKSRAWCDELTETLMKNWLITKARRSALRRRRARNR